MRSPRSVEVGMIISFAAFLGVFLMPNVTPYEFFNCTSSNGGTQCFGSLNSAYPAVLLIGIAGIVLIFFGLFGWRFLLSPFFIIGMLLFGLALSGLVLNYMALESCIKSNIEFFSCTVVSSEFYEPWMLLGTILIGSNVPFWKWRTHGRLKDSLFLSKFSGGILAAVGIVLSFFSYLVIFTRYSSYAGPIITYWIQLESGICFILLGIVLVSLSRRFERKKKVVAEQYPVVLSKAPE